MNRLLRKHIFKKIVKHSSATAMKSYGPELHMLFLTKSTTQLSAVNFFVI